MDPLLLTPAEIERRVFSWLQGRPQASREDWQSLGPEGLKRLYSIAVTERKGARANKLRAAALACLGQFGDPEHLDPLLEVFEEADVPNMVRCGAIEGLGHLGVPRALPLLQSQAFHQDFRVRLYAVAALARMPRALTRRLLKDISMRDPITQVRRAAASELQRLDAPTVGGVETGPSNRDGSVRTHEGLIAAPADSMDEMRVDATLPSDPGQCTEQWAGQTRKVV